MDLIKVVKNKKVQLEFVSVNPTGPVHVGHARGAIVGSCLAKILSYSGFDVHKEYYVNDAGNQIDLYISSIKSKIYENLINISLFLRMDIRVKT